jgi:hypothetical protein
MKPRHLLLASLAWLSTTGGFAQVLPSAEPPALDIASRAGK